MIGVSSSTVRSIIARCSRSRSRYRASAPTALRDSLDLDDLLRLRQLRLGALSAPGQLRDLLIAPVGRPTATRLTELLQRAVADLLAPVRQMRRVQALAAQQLADLARPGARVGFGQDLQLVLRRERPALGLLNQL